MNPTLISLFAKLLILIAGAGMPALIDYIQTKWPALAKISAATEASLAAILAALVMQSGAALGVTLPDSFGAYDPATVQTLVAGVLAYLSSHLTTVHQKTVTAIQRASVLPVGVNTLASLLGSSSAPSGSATTSPAT